MQFLRLVNAVKPSNPMTLAVILRIKHILFCTHAHAHILISILFTAEIISHSISISSKVILKLVPSFCVQQRVHARERERESTMSVIILLCAIFCECHSSSFPGFLCFSPLSLSLKRIAEHQRHSRLACQQREHYAQSFGSRRHYLQSCYPAESRNLANSATIYGEPYISRSI